MRILPAVLVAFVLVIFSVFSVYSAVDIGIECDDVQSNEVIKSSIVIGSDSDVISGRFVLRYNDSVAVLRDVSCSDLHVETIENDDEITVVFASKSKVGVTDSRLKMEFLRLSEDDVTLSFDTAECIDNTKNSCSVSVSGATITIADKAVVEYSDEEDFSMNMASQDSFVVKGERISAYKFISLFVGGVLSIILIVVILIKEQKEMRQSKEQ